MVYKALVTDESNQTKYQYVGLSFGPFKNKYYNHLDTIVKIPSLQNAYQNKPHRLSIEAAFRVSRPSIEHQVLAAGHHGRASDTYLPVTSKYATFYATDAEEFN